MNEGFALSEEKNYISQILEGKMAFLYFSKFCGCDTM
jgi:hypothetical protein